MASRQKTHAKKVRPASKIIVLPCISRAIVLSVSTASVFTLPEFAPVSGIGSLRDISDICRDYDDRSLTEIDKPFSQQAQDAGVLVCVCTKASIRFVRVLPHALKAESKIDYPSAILAFQRSHFSIVANSKSYDLVDLQNNQKIPLFEISTGGDENDDKEESAMEKESESKPKEETESAEQSVEAEKKEEKEVEEEKLKPMVCAVSTEEFLLTSGTKLSEPAMGLIVNTDGDISRGTIAWPKYPSSLAVDYPYVASVIDNQIQIYSLHDQDLVQTIDYPSRPCVYNVSAPISQPYLPLADTIKKVPLTEALAASEANSGDALTLDSEQDQKRLETEATYAESLSVISSSLYAHSQETGLECLLSSPRIFHLTKLVEQQHRMDEVREEMSTMEVSTERAFVEIEYLSNLVGLGYLHNGNFEDAVEFWLTPGTLDPRIMIYVFDKDSVKGDLWQFNGLIKFTKEVIKKIETLKIEAGKKVVKEPKENTPPKSNSFKKSKKAKKKAGKKGGDTDSTDPVDKAVPDNSDNSTFAALQNANQHYESFLREWLRRRDLESVADKPSVFYSLEVAYLTHLLYQQSLQQPKSQTEPTIPDSSQDNQAKLYDFIEHEVIESTDTVLAILGKHNKYYGQFRLYQKLGREEEACALWKQILEGTIQDPDFTQNEQDFALYLQNVSKNKDVIWEYGMWLVNRIPEIGLPIFAYRDTTKNTQSTSNTDSKSTLPSPIEFDDEKVLHELKKLDNREPWRTFLKILVYERHKVSLQSQLIELTVDELLDKLDVKGHGSTRAAKIKKWIQQCNMEYKALPYPKRGCMEFLQGKIESLKQQLLRLQQQKAAAAEFLNTSSIATADPTKNSDVQMNQNHGIDTSSESLLEKEREKQDFIDVSQIRIDLMKLLLLDGNYDAQAICDKLESRSSQGGANEILIPEMCIVYSRLGLADKCIETLINLLLDLDQAIEYCLYGHLTIKGLMTQTLKSDTNKNSYGYNKRNILGLKSITSSSEDIAGTQHDSKSLVEKTRAGGANVGESSSGLLSPKKKKASKKDQTWAKKTEVEEEKEEESQEAKEDEKEEAVSGKVRVHGSNKDIFLVKCPPLADIETQKRLFAKLFDVILAYGGISDAYNISTNSNKQMAPEKSQHDGVLTSVFESDRQQEKEQQQQIIETQISKSLTASVAPSGSQMQLSLPSSFSKSVQRLDSIDTENPPKFHSRSPLSRSDPPRAAIASSSRASDTQNVDVLDSQNTENTENTQKTPHSQNIQETHNALEIQELYACTLLDKHGHFLDTVTVLRKLPSSWPLERIVVGISSTSGSSSSGGGWLRNALRQLLAQKSRSAMTKSLARAENANVTKLERYWVEIKKTQTK